MNSKEEQFSCVHGACYGNDVGNICSPQSSSRKRRLSRQPRACLAGISFQARGVTLRWPPSGENTDYGQLNPPKPAGSKPLSCDASVDFNSNTLDLCAPFNSFAPA